MSPTSRPAPLAATVAIAVVVRLAFGTLYGLYRGRFRFGSFDEVAALTATAVSTTAVVFAAVAVSQPRLVPLSTPLIGGFVALVGTAGSRYVWRLEILPPVS